MNQETRDDEREALKTLIYTFETTDLGDNLAITTRDAYALADAILAARKHPEPNRHDRDRDGICRRCGEGMTARDIVDGEQSCNARKHPEPEPGLVLVDEAMTERMARALFARTKEGREGWTWPINGGWDRRRSMEDARRVLTYVLAIPARVAVDEGKQDV